MKKLESTFIILLVLCVVGLLLWGSALILGFAYLLKGALFTGSVITIAIVAVMGLLVWLMCRYSDPRKHPGNYHNSQVAHWLAFIAYFVVSVASAICVNHALSVTMTSRPVIQNAVRQEIQELGIMFAGPDKEGSYLYWVEEQKANIKRSLTGTMDNRDIDLKVGELGDALVAKSGYNKLKSEACNKEDGFLGLCYYAAATHWTWWNVTDYLSQLEPNKKDYIEKLTEYSQSTDFTKDEPYEFNPQFNNGDLCASLTNPFENKLNFGSLLYIIIAQILILAIYLKTYPWDIIHGRRWDPTPIDDHVYGSTHDSMSNENIQYNPE